MVSPKLSIVIPVYNTAPYLHQCLDSILCSPIQEMEIICIDDGSTDKSLEILRSYADGDSRVRLIVNPHNIGAGLSRNIGIKAAKGEYIATLDSDDYYVIDTLWEAYEKAYKVGADISCWREPTEFDNETGTVWVGERRPLYFQRQLVKKWFRPEDIAKGIFHVLTWCTVGRMCNKQFLIDNEIYFQDRPCANDVYFACKANLYAKKIVYVDKPAVYCRSNRKGQISATIKRHRMSIYSAFLSVKELIDYKRYKHCVYSDYLHLAAVALTGNLDINKTAKDDDALVNYLKFLNSEGLDKLGLNKVNEDDFFYRDAYKIWKRLLSYVKTGEPVEETPPMDFVEGLDNSIFDYLRKRKVQYCLWGYGERGKAFFRAAQMHNVDICCIVDQSPTLRNAYVDGIRVLPLTEQTESFDVVIITNSKFGMDIMETILKSELPDTILLDIDFYRKFRVPLESCLFSTKYFRQWVS